MDEHYNHTQKQGKEYFIYFILKAVNDKLKAGNSFLIKQSINPLASIKRTELRRIKDSRLDIFLFVLYRNTRRDRTCLVERI